MTRRLIMIEVDDTIMVLRGWKAHGLALAAGLRPTYSGVRQGWVADTKRLPDLLAYLQMRNIPVEITQAGASPTTGTEQVAELPGQTGKFRAGASRSDADHHADRDDDQLDLFGGGAA